MHTDTSSLTTSTSSFGLREASYSASLSTVMLKLVVSKYAELIIAQDHHAWPLDVSKELDTAKETIYMYDG